MGRKNHVSPLTWLTDGQTDLRTDIWTDICFYRVALLLKKGNGFLDRKKLKTFLVPELEYPIVSNILKGKILLSIT